MRSSTDSNKCNALENSADSSKWNVSVWRLLLAVCFGLFVLISSKYLLSPGLSAQFVRYSSYWVLWVLILMFIMSLIPHMPKIGDIYSRVRPHSFGICVALIMSIWLHVHERPGYKILFDEYVICDVALNLHLEQDAAHSIRYPIDSGRTSGLVQTVDKRPNLFPFMLSVVHGLFGYSSSNVFWLNGVCSFVLLLLVYGCSVMLGGVHIALVVTMLFGSLPLVAVCANSAGYDTLNLCFIAMTLFFSLIYLRSGGNRFLNPLVLSSVLLANCRYESVVYILIPVAAFCINGFKTKRLVLTRMAAVSPLFLFPPMMSHRIFWENEVFFQTTRDNFMSLAHLRNNLMEALVYLLDWKGDYTNSALFSVFGILALLHLFFGSWISFRRRRSSETLHMVIFAGLVGFNTVLALSVFWGDWKDPMTSRFSLPLQLLFCFAIAWSGVTLSVSSRWNERMVVGVMLYVLAVGLSLSGRVAVRGGYYGSYGDNWMISTAESYFHRDSDLYVGLGALGWTLHGGYAIPLDLVSSAPEELLREEKNGRFGRILLCHKVAKSPFETAPAFIDEENLADPFIVENEFMSRVDYDLWTRMDRIVGYKIPVPGSE